MGEFGGQRTGPVGKKGGGKVVDKNDIHYCRADDAEAQDILVSVQTGARFEDENRLTMRQDNFSLRSPEEMASLFPETPEAIENSYLIADMVDVEIELGKNKIPPFDHFRADFYLLILDLADPRL